MPYPIYIAAHRRELLPHIFTLTVSGGCFLLQPVQDYSCLCFPQRGALPCPDFPQPCGRGGSSYLLCCKGKKKSSISTAKPQFYLYLCIGVCDTHPPYRKNMHRINKILAIALLALNCCACNAKVKQYKIQVVKEYPHDTSSYTQGLFFYDGRLYESTGQYGESTFRLVDLESGKALKRLDFNSKYFIEGSVVMGDKLYILTWESKLAFIYDAATLEYKSTVAYPREGWGITTDGKHLIASDGTARLYFMDAGYKVERTIDVKMDGRPIKYLNELEYIDGKIWANVYLTDMIVIINPNTGIVEGTVDCTGLLPRHLRDSRTDVLNGIAYNPANGKTYLTGKYWKRLYEVKLLEKK